MAYVLDFSLVHMCIGHTNVLKRYANIQQCQKKNDKSMYQLDNNSGGNTQRGGYLSQALSFLKVKMFHPSI